MKLLNVILISEIVCNLANIIMSEVVHPLTESASGAVDFRKIINTTTFVDKSMLIYDLLIHHIVLLAAPKGYGKSTILDMVRRFFELQVDSNGEPKEENPNYDLFLHTNLTIVNYKKYKMWFKNHLGKYPVMYVNYKRLNNITDLDSTLVNFKVLQKEVFSQHKYIINNPKFPLSFEEKRLLSKYIDNSHTDSIELQLGFYRLSEYLRRYFNKSVCVLVDEFDNYLDRRSQIQEESINFMRGVHNYLFNRNKNIMVALIMSEVVERGVKVYPKNVRKDCVFYDHICWSYFGLTESELQAILDKTVEDHDEKKQLKRLLEEQEQLTRTVYSKKEMWQGNYGFLFQPRIFKIYSYATVLHFLGNRTHDRRTE